MTTLPQSPPATEEPDPEPARPPRPPSVGPLLRRLHFYVGVFVAPFLVVSALTGLVYAFAPQLERVAYHDQMYVVETDDHTRPLAEQVAAAQAVVPDGTVTTVAPPETARHTTRVEFEVPELADAERQRTVYVDPYTAQVRGTLVTTWGDTPLLTWISTLHKNLHLGQAGELYSELAASWLWVLVLGGVVLWWRHQRGQRRIRRMLRPDLTASGVRRTRGWHASLGVWLAVGLLALSATGLTWSTHAGARFDQLQEGFDAHRLVPDTALAGSAEGSAEEDPHAHHGGSATGTSDASHVDAVLAAARDHGLDGPVELTPAASADQAWTVTQTDNRWPVRRDAVAVDPHALTVIDEVRWADQPPLAQLSSLGIQAHMGVLFGPVNQVLLASLAVGLLVLILWGYRMWWQRRPTRAGRRRPLGAPPARGAWRRLPTPLLVLGVAVAVAVGWALPVLGWSLLGFLVVDMLLGLVTRRRARREPDHQGAAEGKDSGKGS